MTKPAKRIPRWLAIDIMMLVVGTAIMIVSALLLGADFVLMMAPPS